MARLKYIPAILAIVAAIAGCEFRKNISRDEIPIIKLSITALENVIKTRNITYLDSLLSSDASEEGTSAESILEFVYSGGLREFVGFTHKQIFFRGEAARVDCKITGPDGPTREVTITLRKEEDIWLVKKIEPRIDDPFKEDSNST